MELKMIKRIQITVFIIASILLTSCAQMNSQFDCPMKPGIHCESLDQVNAKVDRGELGNDYSLSTNKNSNDLTFYKVQTRSSADAMRSKDTVLHVWIAPFEDASGNYHAESSVYTVSDTGHWINHPAKALTKDDE
jgi:hypothetical protein